MSHFKRHICPRPQTKGICRLFLEKKQDSRNLRTVAGLTKMLADLMSHFKQQICPSAPQTRGICRHFLGKKPDSPNLQTVFGLKGQYPAIFSNTLKIGKTLFG